MGKSRNLYDTRLRAIMSRGILRSINPLPSFLRRCSFNFSLGYPFASLRNHEVEFGVFAFIMFLWCCMGTAIARVRGKYP